MSYKGMIEQYKGPINGSQLININSRCKIGFSLDEDDFMKWANPENPSNFSIQINGQEIELGRTQMYQTEAIQVNTIIIKNAPRSFKLEVLYLPQ